MDQPNYDDIEQAVARLISGDDAAREQLVQLSYDRLQRLASKMLKQYPVVRRWEQTDDIFQRAAVRLWQSLKQVKPEDSRHYFNLAALQVRRELIEVARTLNGPLGLANNQDSISPRNSMASKSLQPRENPSDTYEPASLATWTDFHVAVGELDDELCETFQLIWYQGLSQDAVAQLLGVSQKSVSRRWQKARRELYKRMGQQLPD